MILLILLFVGALVFTILYFMQFHIELDGKKENIIKDGLIIELMVKASNDPDPTSFIIDTDLRTITMGKITIKKHWSGVFWFPYEVTNIGAYSWENSTVGYVTRYSKDYKYIKALLKKSKSDIEQTQRQKLNLK
jgi:hypothetical protein